jgi:hypothetical protein
MTFLLAALRPPTFPHDPSPSLSIRSRKVTPERSRRVNTDQYSRPIGGLQQCAASGACSLLTTITFLGERQDIFDPEGTVLVDEQTTERRCAVREQPESKLSNHLAPRT